MKTTLKLDHHCSRPRILNEIVLHDNDNYVFM